MKTYIIDIETEPLSREELKAFVPEFKADSRLKDPVKIAEDLLSKESAFYTKATLNALTSKVCAIGIWDVSQPEPQLLCGGDEEKLISTFGDLLKDKSKFITFNGAGFDIPFLCRRGLKYGKDFFSKFFRIDGGLSYDAPLIDLAAMWDCRRKDYTSLNELALHLGVGSKEKGEELFYQTWNRDQAEAKAYLRNDLDLTKKIAKKWGII